MKRSSQNYTPQAESSNGNEIDDSDRLTSEVITCKCKKCSDLGKMKWLEPPVEDFIFIAQHNFPELLPKILSKLRSMGINTVVIIRPPKKIN